MRTLNNEITIHRGETFSMDKIIVNKDNSPYIISSKLRHPHWLLSISTTKYIQANRYIKNYWLDLHKNSILNCASQKIFQFFLDFLYI